MRRQRFPFIIIPPADRTAETGAREDVSGLVRDLRDALAELGRIIEHSDISATVNRISSDAERIMTQNDQTAEKTGSILKRITFLESAVDELVDGEERMARFKDTSPETDAGLEEFFTSLVPVVDRLDSVKRAIDEAGQVAWQRGMALLFEHLRALLGQFDLRPVAEVGTPFDPSVHEAVGARHDSAQEPGAIAEVVQNGWSYRGRLLRQAKVVVIKNQEDTET